MNIGIAGGHDDFMFRKHAENAAHQFSKFSIFAGGKLRQNFWRHPKICCNIIERIRTFHASNTYSCRRTVRVGLEL